MTYSKLMSVQVTAAAAPLFPSPPRLPFILLLETVPSMCMFCFILKTETCEYNALECVQLLNLDRFAIVHRFFARFHTS